MSTTPNPTPNNTAQLLSNITTGVNLALTIGQIAVPLVAGIIKEVKKVQAEGSTEQTYEVTITVGQQELDEADVNFAAALDAANAELTRLGKPTL